MWTAERMPSPGPDRAIPPRTAPARPRCSPADRSGELLDELCRALVAHREGLADMVALQLAVGDRRVRPHRGGPRHVMEEGDLSHPVARPDRRFDAPALLDRDLTGQQ